MACRAVARRAVIELFLNFQVSSCPSHHGLFGTGKALPLASRPLDALFDRTRAECSYDLFVRAPATVKESLGVAAARIGGGVALSVRHDATRHWSSALGLGFAEPLTGDLVGEVCRFYRTQQSQGFNLHLAPAAMPYDWAGIRAAGRFSAGPRVIRLACAVDAFRPPETTTSLRIGPVTPAHASEWANVYLAGFGLPDDRFGALFKAMVGRSPFHAFAAWDGSQLVAVSVLYVRKSIGYLGFSATLPSHRRLGAQTGLFVARVECAAELGCRWLFTEAAQPADGERSQALENMLRVCFKPQYIRTSWEWFPTY